MTVKAPQFEPQLIRQALQERSEQNLCVLGDQQLVNLEVQTSEAGGRLKRSKSSRLRRWGPQCETNSTPLHMHISIKCLSSVMITRLIVRGFWVDLGQW